MLTRIFLALLLCLFFSNNSSANSPELEWELVTPFKFLTDNKIYSIIRSEYDSLSDYESRESPSLALERKLHKADFDGEKYIRNGWIVSIATGGYEYTCWNFYSAKYETSGKCSDYIHPNSHDVKVWLKNSLYSGDTKCEWHHGNRKTINYCNESIVIRSIPYPEGLDVKVTPLVREPYSGPFFQDSKLRWYPAEKGAGNDGSKAKEFYG